MSGRRSTGRAPTPQRRAVGSWPLPCALGVALLASTPGRAQDSQYWDIQYGPVGQLLGGQVVGSTRDLSATYYNPGGLALATNPEFLLSVQAFSVRKYSVQPVGGGPLFSISQTDWATFPGFVALTFPRSWFGEKTQLAFSLLTRQQLVERIDQRFTGDAPTKSGRYGLETLFDENMQETWGGLTLSHRFSDRFGLGATLYGVYRGQRTRWEQSLQLAYPDGSGVSALIVDDFDYSHWRVLGKVGLAWEGDSARLGLAVTTPSAGLFGSGKASFTRSATGADLNGDGQPDSLLLNGLDEDLDSSYRSSWAVSAGGSWRRGSLQIHASGEWFAAVSTFDVLQGKTDTNTGSPITLTQGLRSVFNAGAAVEYWLGGVSADRGSSSGGTALYGSFRTDFSASPDVVPDEAASSNMDLYHVTGGTAFSLGSSRFSLGVEYAFGRKSRDFGVGGLPPGIPVIGESLPVEARISRWVFMVGYLFGR
ncbi:MAG TPA: hypothetical protein VL691_18890 [Vicinamibacteria bacterium]|nr:hypothetical protein [Vicinamibacteria bacterium]